MSKRTYNPVTKRMEVEPPANYKPTIISMARNLGGVAISSAKLVTKKQPILASDEVVAERTTTCLGCLNWNPRAYKGLGKCEACGCSGIKIKLAASKCPIQKWLH
jgi:hypothetical protein